MRLLVLILTISTLCVPSFKYEIPDNLRTFYETVSGQANCTNTLESGFGDGDTDYPNDWSYCEADDVLYIHHDGGGLAMMAFDVDGRRPPRDNPEDSQNATAFDSILQSYNITNLTELNPYIHPYVVFGNQGTMKGYTNFDPTKYAFSVMAVVCNGSLVFGIWGDTNGDDDYPPIDSVGEASQAVAPACFDNPNVNASVGYPNDTILFIAFKGSSAVPGAAGADWAASTYDEFETSIEALGNRLVAQINASASTSPSNGSNSTQPSQTMSSSAAATTDTNLAFKSVESVAIILG